jgi:hypothetical protein
MNQRERHAWHQFRETMAQRQNEFDGQVPVALLVLATCPGCDVCRERKRVEGDDITAVDVHFDGMMSVLRPPGMKPAELAVMFERAAAMARRGTA